MALVVASQFLDQPVIWAYFPPHVALCSSCVLSLCVCVCECVCVCVCVCVFVCVCVYVRMHVVLFPLLFPIERSFSAFPKTRGLHFCSPLKDRSVHFQRPEASTSVPH